MLCSLRLHLKSLPVEHMALLVRLHGQLQRRREDEARKVDENHGKLHEIPNLQLTPGSQDVHGPMVVARSRDIATPARGRSQIDFESTSS